MLWFWIKKEKFNLGHNYTFWKISFHNNTRIPSTFLKNLPVLAPASPQALSICPGSSAALGWQLPLQCSFCFSLWFPVSQQESILSREEIEAFRKGLPPPTTPTPKHSSCQNDVRQFPIQLATPVCMRSLFSKGQSGGTKAKTKGRDQVRR